MKIDALQKLLEARLKDDAPADVTSFIASVRAEGDRYARRKESLGVPKSGRRGRRQLLQQVVDNARSLKQLLAALDLVMIEDLERELGQEKISALIGFIESFAEKATAFLLSMKVTGRPPDIAQERWVYEMADLYESNFGKPAKVYGSAASSSTTNRGPFYELLSFCVPEKRVRPGFLDPTQIRRLLHRREQARLDAKKIKTSASIEVERESA